MAISVAAIRVSRNFSFMKKDQCRVGGLFGQNTLLLHDRHVQSFLELNMLILKFTRASMFVALTCSTHFVRITCASAHVNTRTVAIISSRLEGGLFGVFNKWHRSSNKLLYAWFCFDVVFDCVVIEATGIRLLFAYNWFRQAFVSWHRSGGLSTGCFGRRRLQLLS